MKELVNAGLPDPQVRGVCITRDEFGRIKLDPDFDIQRLPQDIQQEIKDGHVTYRFT